MITFERTQDYDLVRDILTHPTIYSKITDDFSPPVDDFEPAQSEAVWYVIAKDGGWNLGLWLFIPLNGITWDVHVAMLPPGWGKRGHDAARALPEWIWGNTRCRRIVASIPESNRLALHFALSAGMRVYGVNERSFLKNGKLLDQVCLGISAPREMPIPEAETDLKSIVST